MVGLWLHRIGCGGDVQGEEEGSDDGSVQHRRPFHMLAQRDSAEIAVKCRAEADVKYSKFLR